MPTQNFTQAMKSPGRPRPHRFLTLCLVVLAGFIAVPGSKAEKLTSELLANYDKDRERVAAEALAVIMLTGMNRLNAYYKANGKPTSYCLPDDVSLTSSHIIRMLREDVAKAPALAEHRFGAVLLLAMKRRFPCDPA